MLDYSAGHIDNEISRQLIADLQEKFGSDKVTFYPGVSYRNLLVLHGDEFCKDVDYYKPDSSHGINEKDLPLTALNEKAQYTVDFLNKLCAEAAEFLTNHSLNQNREFPANRIWPWSPGYKPALPSFIEKYQGKKGAIISAVDVIKGIGIASNMTVIEVEGATGYIDTNYENKAAAALEALKEHDFVYIHVEGIDEVSHLGSLELKIKAIEDFDKRLVGKVLEQLKNQDVRIMILPDHPVPIKLRQHTTTPVPFAIAGSGIACDNLEAYNEKNANKGSLGLLKRDELMHLILGL
jgi:2,3-bisphosphoglycerate-independent phosphoglycerate mutase